jgi:hypothetical protein
MLHCPCAPLRPLKKNVNLLYKNILIQEKMYTSNSTASSNILKKAFLKKEEKLNQNDLADEAFSISQRTTKLFPKEYQLEKETTELFRAMCILSQCTLRDNNTIRSHRPVVGRIIVFFKKCVWKMVEPQIKHVFHGVQDCFSCLIGSHAKLLVRIKELEIEQKNKN